MKTRPALSGLLLAASLSLFSCDEQQDYSCDGVTDSSSDTDIVSECTADDGNPFSLWNAGTCLRGFNVYQRRTYPELEEDWNGSDPIGPPLVQADFDDMAAFGANYVNLSHPGPFTEVSPYELDPEVEASLDRTLEMIAEADLFVVIAFRTGPGRSEFTFLRDELEEDDCWFDASYLNESVWSDQAAQDAWVEMWRHVAERYRDMPNVVGYDLMVEPNSNEILDVWDMEEFDQSHGDSIADWNRMGPPIVQGIREMDDETPILIGGNSYSSVEWLDQLRPVEAQRVVYTVHQYAPVMYTHQGSNENIPYPACFDADWDEETDQVDVEWLRSVMGAVPLYAARADAPIAVNELGVVRWVPNGARFLRDQLNIVESNGWSWALWEWMPAWERSHGAEANDSFCVLYGTSPGNHSDDPDNELASTVREALGYNTVKPSTFFD